ncbi:hypothetical protein M422DRAFT_247277 [Sphaerobolus stellatus SS14]|nr:hypothetical protein M422DRAFT_247277 [Sphaerobolus stellatus SS14]
MVFTRKKKDEAAANAYTNMSVAELQARIAEECQKELNTCKAKTRHNKKLPEELEAGWANAVVIACHQRLAELQASNLAGIAANASFVPTGPNTEPSPAVSGASTTSSTISIPTATVIATRPTRHTSARKTVGAAGPAAGTGPPPLRLDNTAVLPLPAPISVAAPITSVPAPAANITANATVASIGTAPTTPAPTVNATATPIVSVPTLTAPTALTVPVANAAAAPIMPIPAATVFATIISVPTPTRFPVTAPAPTPTSLMASAPTVAAANTTAAPMFAPLFQTAGAAKFEADEEMNLFTDIKASEVDDGDGNNPSKRRPGGLAKEEMRILREKHAELDAWVEEKAWEWHVNPISIYVNMGFDNRERRATSFWNKFQAVFWHRVHNPPEGEESPLGDAMDSDGLVPKPLLILLQEKCSKDYAHLSKEDDPNMSLEEKEAVTCEHQEIYDVYNDLHDPENVQYKEGDTQKLMRQARKEFTTRALFYSSRGVGVAGWVVSLDPVDATASAGNFMFAGNDGARKWFDTHAINMRKTMRDFETSVRYVQLQEAEHRMAGLRHIYLAHCNSNDRRRKEISRMLKEIWSDLMDGAAPHHLCWDEWAEDMLLAQARMVGWPDSVPCPGRLCAQDGLEVKIEPWSKDELEAIRTIPINEREEDDTWLNMVLVQGHSGQQLLTIRDIVNARSRAQDAKAKHRGRSEVVTSGDDEEHELEQASDNDKPALKLPHVSTKMKASTQPKAATKRKGSSEPQPTTKPAKKRVRDAVNDGAEETKSKKAHHVKVKSSVTVESGDDMSTMDEHTLMNLTPDGLLPQRPLDPNFKPVEGRRQKPDAQSQPRDQELINPPQVYQVQPHPELQPQHQHQPEPQLPQHAQAQLQYSQASNHTPTGNHGSWVQADMQQPVQVTFDQSQSDRVRHSMSPQFQNVALMHPGMLSRPGSRNGHHFGSNLGVSTQWGSGAMQGLQAQSLTGTNQYSGNGGLNRQGGVSRTWNDQDHRMAPVVHQSGVATGGVRGEGDLDLGDLGLNPALEATIRARMRDATQAMRPSVNGPVAHGMPSANQTANGARHVSPFDGYQGGMSSYNRLQGIPEEDVWAAGRHGM